MKKPVTRTGAFIGTPGRIRVILRLAKMQALAEAAKQGKLGYPLGILAYRFESIKIKVAV